MHKCYISIRKEIRKCNMNHNFRKVCLLFIILFLITLSRKIVTKIPRFKSNFDGFLYWFMASNKVQGQTF